MFPRLTSLFPKKISDFFAARENAGKIATNTLWLVADKVIRILLTLVVTGFLSRYLSIGNFGKLSNALTYFSLFGAFATLGIDSILVRDLVRFPDKKNEILGSAFVLRTITSILCYLSCLGFVFLMRKGPENQELHILVAIISIGLIFQSFDIIDYHFQAKTNSKYTVVSKLSAFVLSSLLKVYLIHSQAGLVAFAWVSAIEVIAAAAILIFAYQYKSESIWRWRYNYSTSIRLFKESMPIFIAYVAAFTYMKIDQILIADMKGDEVSGLFYASARIYELCFIVISVLTPSFYPSLINIFDRKDLFLKRYQQITSVYSILGYILVFSTILLAPTIIKLQYGSGYEESASILRIQIFGMLFMFNSGLRSSYLAIAQRQDIIMVTSVISAILNVSLNLVLIPRFGMYGSAWATVITCFISFFIGNLFFKETHRLFKIQLNGFLLLGGFKLIKFLRQKQQE